jgi:hypothetical protein
MTKPSELMLSGKNPEYMFLQGGKFMPGMEKLAGELFFPTNSWF